MGHYRITNIYSLLTISQIKPQNPTSTLEKGIPAAAPHVYLNHTDLIVCAYLILLAATPNNTLLYLQLLMAHTIMEDHCAMATHYLSEKKEGMQEEEVTGAQVALRAL